MSEETAVTKIEVGHDTITRPQGSKATTDKHATSMSTEEEKIADSGAKSCSSRGRIVEPSRSADESSKDPVMPHRSSKKAKKPKTKQANVDSHAATASVEKEDAKPEKDATNTLKSDTEFVISEVAIEQSAARDARSATSSSTALHADSLTAASKTWATVYATCNSAPEREVMLRDQSILQEFSSVHEEFPVLPASPAHAILDAGRSRQCSQSPAGSLNVAASKANNEASPPSPSYSTTSAVATYANVANSSPSTLATSGSPEADIPTLQEPPKSSVSPMVTAVVHQPHENFYTMIRQKRQKLFQGPMITLRTGNTAVNGIYKRVAMAASPVLNKHFVEHPDSIEYSFSDHVVPGAVRYLLDIWMRHIRDAFEVYAVPGQDSFIKNVTLLRAARLLGMERYTRYILESHIVFLKNNLPTYEHIIIIEDNATSDKDPLWTSMVNHLCHERHKQLMPDPEDFAAFLENHLRLKAAMESADAYFAGEARKKWESRRADLVAEEEERRARWEQNQAEQEERIAREKEATESLRRKMGAQGGSGLMMATPEEAELLRSR